MDFEKGFNKVQRGKLISILHESRIDNREVEVISKLYILQTPMIQVVNQSSEEFSISRGYVLTHFLDIDQQDVAFHGWETDEPEPEWQWRYLGQQLRK